MGRPRRHGIIVPHPSPRFRDRIRLHRGVSSPTDMGWRATYKRLDGTWTPIPLALKTKDWDEACEVARDRIAVLDAGGEIPKAVKPKASKQVEHSLAMYGEMAIKGLEERGEAAARIHPGKEAKFKGLIRYIRDPLIRDLGTLDIRKLDEATIDDWAYNYRINGKGKVPKRPAATTLGNIDWALKFIWEEAARARVVSYKARPIISKRHADQEAGTPRPFIDEDGIREIYKVMSTEAWVNADPHRRLTRVYIALLATAGFRPGLELTRTLIGDIKFETQEGVDVILIQVRKNAGKRKKERFTTVYEGSVFPVRTWLKDLLEIRKAQGAQVRDPLFQCEGRGTMEQRMFRQVQQVLSAAKQLVDPMTGQERSAYSIRHSFATSCIDRGLSYAKIAAWMGTSEQMIELHYNRYSLHKKAHEHAGSEAERNQALIHRWQSEDTSEYAVPTDLRK